VSPATLAAAAAAAAAARAALFPEPREAPSTPERLQGALNRRAPPLTPEAAAAAEAAGALARARLYPPSPPPGQLGKHGLALPYCLCFPRSALWARYFCVYLYLFLPLSLSLTLFVFF
jgi:hypothetical protein